MSKFLIAAGGNSNASGSWSNVSSASAGGDGVPAATDDVILDAGSGQLTINAAMVGKTLTTTGYTNTLTHNAFAATFSGSVTLVAGMTYSPLATSTLIINATGTLTTGGKLIPNLTHSGGTLTLGDNLSFVASKAILFTLNGTTFNMNGKSINGNSTTNRVLIGTSVIGTPKTITNATTSFTNADFQDITFSSASNLDLSAITGKSGDCGGNSITGGGSTLTFTPSQTNFYQTAVSDNWSTTAKWFLATNGTGGAGRVPLPQDGARFDANSFTASNKQITGDVPRLGKDVDWTGAGNTGAYVNGLLTTIFGSLTQSANISYNWSNNVMYQGRTACTMTNAGSSMASITIQMFGGSMTLQDAFAGSQIMLLNGTFDANNMSVTCTKFFADNSTATRQVKMGTGVWTITGAVAIPWANSVSTGMTVTPGTSTIVLTDTSATVKKFAGGGFTYYNLTCSGGTGEIDFTGSNTFNVLTLNCAGATNPYRFTNSTTTTVISLTQTNADASHVGSLDTVSGSSTFTFSDSVGVDALDYFTITRSVASGGASFYAGAHSTDGGSNTGWIFSGAVVGVSTSLGAVAGQSNQFTNTLVSSVGLAGSAGQANQLSNTLGESVGLSANVGLADSLSIAGIALSAALPSQAQIQDSLSLTIQESIQLAAFAQSIGVSYQIVAKLAVQMLAGAGLDVNAYQQIRLARLTQDATGQPNISGESWGQSNITNESWSN